ncbi:MAG TPA: shikimate kinase [Acidimicrobiales bacterium]|nr:shikimate kinase [Acidimicrobiales bacterium]
MVLVGLMGTGKTSVGRRVAERLGRCFVDSDAQVEARTGRTVRQIFEQEGEVTFRRLESEALAEALGQPEPVVIGAAGGVVLDPANRARLRRAQVVWLRAEPAALVSRVAHGDHRPLLGEDSLGALEAMAEQRSSLYQEVAGGREVDVSHRSVDEAVDAVLAVLG